MPEARRYSKNDRTIESLMVTVAGRLPFFSRASRQRMTSVAVTFIGCLRL
ncbi:MAG: hypothetical protein M3388_17860 [Acidobacteriota bacterium]|nr:hypothetical protein [Acidobacteriota bacterium]